MPLNTLFLGFLLLALTILSVPRAQAEGRIQVTEENDVFASPDDRHYTQGLRFSWLPGKVAPDSSWNNPYSWLANHTPIFGGGNFERQYDWSILGQSIFTPQNIHTASPPATDRPYGAWLYTGVSLLQENKDDGHSRLENVELLLGVIGPLALGKQTQNDWHQFIGVQPAEGWKNQLHNEPGLTLSYERKWRFEKPLGDILAVDAIPEMGGTLGNVFTYGEAGGLLRFGHNLGADYGSSHIRPSLSGTGWFDESGMKDKIGWYFFLGAQGRAVGHNIFLDGNTWRSSLSVDKKPFVADFMAGASLFWSQTARLDFTVTERTREFYGQEHPDRFGSVGLTMGF